MVASIAQAVSSGAALLSVPALKSSPGQRPEERAASHRN
jgi:hypothetical protein